MNLQLVKLRLKLIGSTLGLFLFMSLVIIFCPAVFIIESISWILTGKALIFSIFAKIDNINLQIMDELHYMSNERDING